MATRYSGNATIRVIFIDAGGFYRTAVSVGGRCVWRGTVGAPAAGYGPGIAYDSPEAYDRTAHAALSFAEHEGAGLDPAYDTEGEVMIFRSKGAQ